MEISLMVAQLKTEAESIGSDLDAKKAREKALQLELGALDGEIKSLTEKYNAVLGAINQLKPVCPEEISVGGAHAIKVPEKRRGHSTTPRKIGKFDANGNKIGEYPSVCQAAKAFGWGNAPMKKYILTESRERQIRIRGFYLEFIAA